MAMFLSHLPQYSYRWKPSETADWAADGTGHAP